MKINKKGFTLVEILVVIALIGLILGLGVPGIMKLSENSKKRTYKQKVSLIESAGVAWGNNNKTLLKSTTCDIDGIEYDCYKVSVERLIEDDYLNSEKNGEIAYSDPTDNTKSLIHNCVFIYKKNNRVYSKFSDEKYECQTGFVEEYEKDSIVEYSKVKPNIKINKAIKKAYVKQEIIAYYIESDTEILDKTKVVVNRYSFESQTSKIISIEKVDSGREGIYVWEVKVKTAEMSHYLSITLIEGAFKKNGTPNEEIRSESIPVYMEDYQTTISAYPEGTICELRTPYTIRAADSDKKYDPKKIIITNRKRDGETSVKTLGDIKNVLVTTFEEYMEINFEYSSPYDYITITVEEGTFEYMDSNGVTTYNEEISDTQHYECAERNKDNNPAIICDNNCIEEGCTKEEINQGVSCRVLMQYYDTETYSNPDYVTYRLLWNSNDYYESKCKNRNEWSSLANDKDLCYNYYLYKDDSILLIGERDLSYAIPKDKVYSEKNYDGKQNDIGKDLLMENINNYFKGQTASNIIGYLIQSDFKYVENYPGRNGTTVTFENRIARLPLFRELVNITYPSNFAPITADYSYSHCIVPPGKDTCFLEDDWYIYDGIGEKSTINPVIAVKKSSISYE